MTIPTLHLTAGIKTSRTDTFGPGFQPAHAKRIESMACGFNTFLEPHHLRALEHMERLMGAPWPEAHISGEIFMHAPGRPRASTSHPLRINYNAGVHHGRRDYAQMMWVLGHELAHRFFAESPEFKAVFSGTGRKTSGSDHQYHALCDVVANQIVRETLGETAMKRSARHFVERTRSSPDNAQRPTYTEQWMREWNPEKETLLAHLTRHFETQGKPRRRTR